MFCAVHSVRMGCGKPKTISRGRLSMKNPYEVLRQKEAQMRELEVQVEALRIVAPLLSEESQSQDGDTLTLQLADKLERPAAG
jgi:hypothetical protein